MRPVGVFRTPVTLTSSVSRSQLSSRYASEPLYRTCARYRVALGVDEMTSTDSGCPSRQIHLPSNSLTR